MPIDDVLGGLSAIVGSIAGIKIVQALQDPFDGLREDAPAYSGSESITVAQARAYPELRDQFARQCRELVNTSEIEGVFYAQGQEEIQTIWTTYLDAAFNRGLLPEDRRKRFFESFEQYAPRLEDALKKAATTMPILNVTIGKKCPDVLILTPYLFSIVVATK
ncbi:hypothetical protein J4457_05335 [Candidatus Woesearchaeota archaeon]|nr:hypothetical protein [Candidatus Woesearchaeota archaeon]